MSVEQYGAGLLAEVQEESLDELLRDIRLNLGSLPKSILGLRWLDELLELFRYHQQPTPARHPAWLADKNGLDGLDDESETPARGSALAQKPLLPVIELASSHSASGKTSLLYLVAAHALLPTLYGGKASAAVWIDCDGRFSIARLFQVMKHLIATTDPKVSPDSLIHTALSNLYILTPSSSSQLLSDLQSLPAKLLALQSTRALSLINLDSATSFGAQDRFDTDIARLEAGPDYSSRPQTPTRTAQIISTLRNIQQTFNCAIIFSSNTPPAASHPAPTTALPSHRSSSSSSTTYNNPPRPQPPSTPSLTPWTAFALLTLRTSRIPVTQFAPSASLEECLRDREKRQVAVAEGRVSVGLDWSGSDRWPPGVREAVERLEGRGRLEIRVGEGDGSGVAG